MIKTEIVKVEQEIVTAYKCDRCTKEYDPFDFENVQEFLHINFTGGYGSIFGDGTEVKCDLCQQCLYHLISHVVIDKEHYKSVDYPLAHREGVAISNEDILEKSQKEALKDIHQAFQKVEASDLVVERMLVSPEIKKMFESWCMYEELCYTEEEEKVAKLYDDCFDGACGYFWTADVKIIDGLDEIIFLSCQKEDLKFEQRWKVV